MPPPFDQGLLTAGLREVLGKLSFQNAVGLVVATVITYAVGLAAYRLWFHPLAKIPGPKLSAVTDIPVLYGTFITGTFSPDSPELHRKYGPIVRTGPNRIAVASKLAWPEVYLFRKGKEEWTKVPQFHGELEAQQIVGALTTEQHRRQRRHLGHAFSEAALYEQEDIIMKYVNMFFYQLDKRATSGEPVNLERWFNYLTFDIIGDLSFGDSFHCLDNEGYHPWVEMMFSGARGSAAERFRRYAPFISALFWPMISYFNPSLAKDSSANTKTVSFAFEKGMERMAMGESPGGRRDFMTHMMRKNKDGENPISDEQIVAHVPLLIGAGSETTATALTAFAYFLQTNPAAFKKVVEEIRGAFTSVSDITMRSTARLPYFFACIEETLRIFPPLTETPPRRSPGDTVGGYWIPKDTNLTTYQYAAHHDPNNFLLPESFIPERWLPASHPDYDSRFAGDIKSVFNPFSAGPRNCIGKNLAYAEVRVIIARFLYKYDYEILPGHESWHKNLRSFLSWEKRPLMAKLAFRPEAEA